MSSSNPKTPHKQNRPPSRNRSSKKSKDSPSLPGAPNDRPAPQSNRPASVKSHGAQPKKSVSHSVRRPTPQSPPVQHPAPVDYESLPASRTGKSAQRIIFANEAGYSIAVIVEDQHLTDFWIEEEQTYDRGITGNIYRGSVTRVVPALNAAFVDIGLEKDGFLSFSDLGPDFRKQAKTERHHPHRSDPPLKVGDMVLVQMAKEMIADKGPSLTGKISLPGRFVVYMPQADAIRMSRMLGDGEKKRFRELVNKEFTLKGGLIFRTASKGKTKAEIQYDLDYLNRAWKRIQKDFDDGETPRRIHQELNLFERVLRDQFSGEIAEIVVDHPRLKHRIASCLKVMAPRCNPDDLIAYHTDTQRSVWSKYNLVKDIDQLFTNRIRLNCGGFIIIEEMETLTAIDVNSGKNVGGKTQEQTILETNLEAAIEISRQLRLRQIGGIIIIDFIDMRLKRNQERVFKTLEIELERDRTPSDIQQFTDLGLIQLTRQRSGESLTKRLTYTCPHCNGSGRRPSLLLS